MSVIERRWAISEPPTLPFEGGSCPVRLLDPISGMAIYRREVEVVDAATLRGAVGDRDALATMLKRLLDVALVDGYGETVRDEAEALLNRIGGQ